MQKILIKIFKRIMIIKMTPINLKKVMKKKKEKKAV